MCLLGRRSVFEKIPFTDIGSGTIHGYPMRPVSKLHIGTMTLNGDVPTIFTKDEGRETCFLRGDLQHDEKQPLH